MILRYDIPQNAESMVELSEGERIYYSVPIDIDEKGNWTDDSYFVVTTSKLYVIRGKKKTEINIADLDKATAEPGIGGGILTVRQGESHRVLVHYSSKHLGR